MREERCLPRVAAVGSRRTQGELWTLQVSKDSGGDGDLSSQGEETHLVPGCGPPVEAPLRTQPGPRRPGRVRRQGVGGWRVEPGGTPCPSRRAAQTCRAVTGVSRAPCVGATQGAEAFVPVSSDEGRVEGGQQESVFRGARRGWEPASQRSFLLWEQLLGQVLAGGVDLTAALPTRHWTVRGQGDPQRGAPGLGP